MLRDLNQQTPFLLGTFKQNVGCGGKNLAFQKVMALLICLKNAFQVGVRFALGFGLELWNFGTVVVAGYEGCANNTFVFVMKEKKT